MVEDGESKNESHGRCPIDEEQKGLRKNPRGILGGGGDREQDATVSKYEEKRWKEDVRERRR